MPAVTVAMGRIWPITPVEATPTKLGSIPNLSAVVVYMCLAWITPICPVTALALPELTIIACSWPF